MRVAGIAKAMDGYVTRLDYACQNGCRARARPADCRTMRRPSAASSAPKAANPTRRAA